MSSRLGRICVFHCSPINLVGAVVQKDQTLRLGLRRRSCLHFRGQHRPSRTWCPRVQSLRPPAYHYPCIPSLLNCLRLRAVPYPVADRRACRSVCLHSRTCCQALDLAPGAARKAQLSPAAMEQTQPGEHRQHYQ